MLSLVNNLNFRRIFVFLKNNFFQSGGSHHGFWLRLKDTPEGPSYTTAYCPKNIPLGTFFNNSVHSNGRFGLWIFPEYHPKVTGACGDTTPKAAIFDTFYVYNVVKGAEWVMSYPMQFKNFVTFDNSETGLSAFTNGAWKENNFYNTALYSSIQGAVLENCIIIGNTDSTSPKSISESGVVLAWDRGVLLSNVSFYNFPDSNSKAIRGPYIDGTCS